MATSNSINLSATGTDIITEALEQLGVLGEGDSPSAAQLVSCNRTLNYLIKAWQADGLNLFALQRVYVFLQKNTREYSLSASGWNSTTAYNSTQIATAGASSDVSIEVDDIAGISDGDFIGVEVDDGTMHWTTVNGAPSGTTVAITDALDGAVSVDSYVYSYTTKASRPMKIERAVVRDVNNTDIPMYKMSLEEYTSLTPKTTDGQTIQFYYDPQVGAGKLFVWPETNDVTDVMVCWVQRTLHDIDTVGSDDVDFPQEWFLPLALNLAVLLIPKYGAVGNGPKALIPLANYYYDMAVGFDSEDGFNIEPASMQNMD